MSKLLDNLESLPESNPTKDCRFLEWFRSHPEDQDQIVATVSNHRYSTRILAAALTKGGLDTSAGTILKHRKNECKACSRAGLSYEQGI